MKHIKKVVFLTLGTRGDLFPYLGMAKEMQRRGYRAVVASSDAHRAICESEGCEFLALDGADTHKALMAHPKMWTPLRGLLLFLGHAGEVSRRTFSLIEREATDGETAIVFNSLMFGAQVAREKFALPAVHVNHIPFSRISVEEPARNAPWMSRPLDFIGRHGRRFVMGLFKKLLNWRVASVNELRRDVGLPPVGDIVGQWRETNPVNLDLWPDWYCPLKVDQSSNVTRTGFVEYSGPSKPGAHWDGKESLQHILASQPIVFTLGSEMNQDFDAQVALFSGACKRMGVAGLMISPVVRGMGPRKVNDSFYVIDAPYAEIFPHASVILSHGGVGTVARVLGLGKPHMITPLAADHFDNAHLVQRLGAGIGIPFRSLNVEKLANALYELRTSTRIAETCAHYSARFKGSGTERAADFLEGAFKRAV